MKVNKTKVKSIIDSKERKSKSEIEKFKKEVENSLNHALKWYTEGVLKEINLLSILEPFIILVNQEDYKVDDLIQISQKAKKDAISFFKNAGFRLNSSSAMSNLDSISLGKAYGELLEIIEYIEKELEQEF